MTKPDYKRDDIVKLDGSFALVLTCGPLTFDAITESGGTHRYPHGLRDIRLVVPSDFHGDANYERDVRNRLAHVAADARAERASGARVKRGQVWPSR